MAARKATTEEVEKYQRLRARCDEATIAVAGFARAKAQADDAMQREQYLKDRYDADLSAFIIATGGTPTPPKLGTTGEWMVLP